MPAVTGIATAAMIAGNTLPVIIAYTGFSYRVFQGKTIELDYA
jgi:cytochrome bd-type quinol oxidase subunit 2